jgi:hypothetical protein
MSSKCARDVDGGVIRGRLHFRGGRTRAPTPRFCYLTGLSLLQLESFVESNDREQQGS